jgi:fluoride exporter
MVPKAALDNRGMSLSSFNSLWPGIVAVSAGASIGALLRWALSAGLNQLFPSIPPGTLIANVIGGYLVGVAVTLFAQQPGWPDEWRLFVITGFLGGLTTFSTFSAEVMLLLQQGRLLWASAAIAAHLIGSLLATLAGIASVELLRRA